MAYISFQPKDFFKTVLYTGNSTARDIGGVGFQPDITLIKGRTSTENWHLFDSARGATIRQYTNVAVADGTISTTLDEFQADGFGIGGADDGVNQNTIPFVAYNWKSGTTSGLSGGTITPTSYSFSTTSGISVLTYTGNGTSGATIPHGLGKEPKFVFVKKRDSGTSEAMMVYNYHVGGSKYMKVHDGNAAASHSGIWNNSGAGSDTFTVGNNDATNASGGTYVAWIFAPITGFSSYGKYVGNAQATGSRIYTGFKPSLVIVKRHDGTSSWITLDKARGTNKKHYLDSSGAEATEETITFMTDGFKIRNTGGDYNTNGANYIFMAFADTATVSSNGKAATAV